MGDLRNKIRSMVRNEFARRLVGEAYEQQNADTADATKAYRASNYDLTWSGLPEGGIDKKKPDAPSPEATKTDFVRWFLKTYVNAANSTLNLTPEQRDRVMAVLGPVKDDPDQFVEMINKERELVFGASNYRSDPDPVYKLLQAYTGAKSMIPRIHGSSDDLDKLVPDDGTDADKRKYNVAKDGEEKQTGILDMFASDPTESGTKERVRQRLNAAMEHLGGEDVIHLLKFLKDPNTSKGVREDVLNDLEELGIVIGEAMEQYTNLFVKAMVPAFRNVTSADDDASLKSAFAQGLVSFQKVLEANGVARMGSQEIDVFSEVFNEDVGEGKTVLDLVIAASKNPGSADVYMDEIKAAALDVFRTEYADRQTNFNTMGDFVDANAEVKRLRQEVYGTVARRGRPAASPGEIGGPAPAAPAADVKRPRGRPPKAR